ncbi:MAG: butyrate kinase [Mogibacterium sp.]|nr:butyrate kinase [Mogibacterium sp.]
MLILTLNLGSTSSKVAVFEDSEEKFSETVRHDAELLAKAKMPADQFEFRKENIYAAIENAGYKFTDFDAVCSRAGLIGPIESGTYNIDDNAIRDAQDPELGGRQPHGLGMVIAKTIRDEYGIPAFFCDPVSTDEFTDVARVSGFKGMERISRFHALNQKAVARKCAETIGKPYEELNLIGIHLGGGTSVAAHEKGRCVEIHDCSEEGAFSMDRSGHLPTNQLVDYCFSGRSKSDIKFTLKREGGVFSYLGTSDMREVEAMMDTGNEEAEVIFRAFAYQHAKCVGEMAAAMCFDVDGIFITGGIAYSKRMVEMIKRYVEKLAPVYVFPGEEEMRSLAEGALRVLKGGYEAKVYEPVL